MNLDIIYRKVVSKSTTPKESRLFMKGKFDAYVKKRGPKLNSSTAGLLLSTLRCMEMNQQIKGFNYL